MQTGAAAARVLQSEATPSAPTESGASALSGSRLTVPLSPVEIERFAGYVVVAKIGQGGMAQIHLALADGPNNFRKLLALKRLHPHLAHEPTQAAMFLQEAALAARLSHPNIVQTFEVGHSEAQHYTAMEYLDGQPLDRVLARLRRQQCRMPSALAVGIVCELLEGLHHAHEARDFDGAPLSIVHRDVSPHNVFITYDGQVKLIDFGIAKSGAQHEQTRTGLLKGKLAYIAPEQARGEPVDRRADLWSAAVTLWYCLTGQRLFRGNNEVELLRAALTDEIPRLSDLLPELPDELSEVMDRALQRDRRHRYSTALDFKRALEPFRRHDNELDTRTALSQVMRALFHDEMAARREVIASCMAQVAALRGAQESVGSEARASLPELPQEALNALRSEPPLRLSKSMRWALAGSLAVLLGALGSLLSDGRDHVAPVSAARAVVVANAAPQSTPAQATSTQGAASAPVHAAAEAPTPQHRPTQRAQRIASRQNQQDPESVPTSKRTQAEPTPQQVQAPGARGHLTLDSVPYSIVTLNGERLGITPIDVELPATSHQLLLRNPELGLETQYQVTIRAGETIQRRVALE